MFKKKIALLSLVSIISNFSLFTTNVLAYEIKENSKKIASTEVIKKDSSKNKKTSKNNIDKILSYYLSPSNCFKKRKSFT